MSEAGGNHRSAQARIAPGLAAHHLRRATQERSPVARARTRRWRSSARGFAPAHWTRAYHPSVETNGAWTLPANA
eukprot:scaffold21511_cov133-Isochrysis_galbana.AAC.2